MLMPSRIFITTRLGFVVIAVVVVVSSEVGGAASSPCPSFGRHAALGGVRLAAKSKANVIHFQFGGTLEEWVLYLNSSTFDKVECSQGDYCRSNHALSFTFCE
jgi:hypothetical protein